MDFFHGFGIRDDEIVVATVVLLAAEMLSCEILFLQAGAHRAVEDKDFLFECVKIFSICIFSFGHKFGSPRFLTFNQVSFKLSPIQIWIRRFYMLCAKI